VTGRRAILGRVLPAADLVLLVGGFVAAYRLRFGSPPPADGAGHTVAHLLLGLALLGAWPPAFFLLDLYDPVRFRSPLRLAGRVAQAAVLVGLLSSAALFAAKAKLASRAVLAGALGLAAAGAWFARLASARWLAAEERERRVLVVGGGEEAVRLLRRIPGARAVEPDGLRGALDAGGVDHVLVATAWEHVAPSVATCLEVGADVSVAAPLPGPVLARAVPDRLYGTPVLRLHGSPQYRAAIVGKRAVDLVGALVLLPLTLPVLALAALAVLVTSGRPVLFAQERVGLGGRRFRMYKLRTMHAGAEPSERELGVKDPDDPRVTAVGRFLRRSSIDELPQLFNVLRGDISLVGPRPPLPEEVERYDRWQRRRLSMRPGLTGLWQVSGRSELGFDECLRLDLLYIDNWSPWLDLKILVRTVPAVLSGRGAR